MTRHQPTVILRLDRTLHDSNLQNIYRRVAEAPGVLYAQPGVRLRNLMLVKYDASRVSALQILGTARNDDQSAFLVAM